MINQIRNRIIASSSILVMSHIRPDGDAIGSVLGLGLALEGAGKSVQMVLADGVPDALQFFKYSDKIKKKAEGLFDLIITLDTSDLERLGYKFGDYGTPDINIDHHKTNSRFAKINYIDSEAAATTEILADLIPGLGFEITSHIASVLLAGILTDTIGFRVNSVTPKTLRISATLMELGGNLTDLYRQSLLLRSASAIRYWGAGLLDLQAEGKMVWTSLTLDDRRRAGYSGRDDADLINVLSGIRDIYVALIFVEQADNHVKVSWRSQERDVSLVAEQFGGGGHKAASGADIQGSLEEVRTKVLDATRELLRTPNK